MALITPDLSGITDGQVGDAADWRTPLTTIIDEINGNLDADNLSADAVTYPKVSEFDKVRATKNANQAIGDSTNTDVTWNTETFDTSGIHSVSSNTERLTAVTTGYYLITANINWAANGTGVRQQSIVHSADATIATTTFHHAGTTDLGTTVSTLYYMTAGQYVKVVVQQNSGGNLNVLSSYSSFQMTLIA